MFLENSFSFSLVNLIIFFLGCLSNVKLWITFFIKNSLVVQYIYKMEICETEKIIFICIDCGDEIERAIKYQIRQDRCPDCFKKKYKKNIQVPLGIFFLCGTKKL